MCFRVHLVVHSALLICELGILGVTFVKLANDSRDADQNEAYGTHYTLTILSCVLTVITFSLTIMGSYVMSRISRFKFPAPSVFLKHRVGLVFQRLARHSSTVAAEPVMRKSNSACMSC